MITAEIVADNYNGVTGDRITSFVCTYPRFIHSEVMTHRAFSRNAASSRAIPVSKVIENIRKTPAMPVHWGKNQRGMQAEEELSPEQIAAMQGLWMKAAENAIGVAEEMNAIGAHKQVVNRILEPFVHMVTLITATEWENFFALRAHKDAQPEFQVLAFAMLDAYRASKPHYCEPGDLHTPFHGMMPEGLTNAEKMKVATARAARVSYRTFDGQIDPQKDFELHDSLLASGHMSPFEHSAFAMGSAEFSGNFKGWVQYRKQLAGENKSFKI